jgi:hypothetical protein
MINQVADAHVRRLISVVKMATVLGGCITEEQHSAVFFLWAKALNANDILKKFPAYGWMSLSPKAVHNWVEKRDKTYADDEEVGTEVWTWLRQQPKDFGFDALINRWDKCISVGGRNV